MRFKFQGHILRPIEGTGPSPVSPLTCTLTGIMEDQSIITAIAS